MHQPDAATGCCWSRRELSWVVGKNAGGTQTNVPIFYDGLKWDVIEGSLQWLILPSGLRKRYATFAKFMSRSTGGWVWICSAHLASGGIDEPKEVQLRDKQIQMIYDYIRTLDDPDRIAILMDANSLDEVPAFMNAHGYKTIHTSFQMAASRTGTPTRSTAGRRHGTRRRASTTSSPALRSRSWLVRSF
jgi:hypothetical protein